MVTRYKLLDILQNMKILLFQCHLLNQTLSLDRTRLNDARERTRVASRQTLSTNTHDIVKLNSPHEPVILNRRNDLFPVRINRHGYIEHVEYHAHPNENGVLCQKHPRANTDREDMRSRRVGLVPLHLPSSEPETERRRVFCAVQGSQGAVFVHIPLWPELRGLGIHGFVVEHAPALDGTSALWSRSARNAGISYQMFAQITVP